MARNIVIFADGTGQRGGLFLDEHRSNIYKLYRAARCGPDCDVNPQDQLAFYSPGLGTLPPNTDLGIFGAIWRRFYNLSSQATGLGITRNIIECYAAIIRMWRPGDRIFLFGFSRGAYTVRCLGGVLALCGVPTRRKKRDQTRYSEKVSRQIATEAVTKVYQHTESRRRKQATPRQRELLVQRRRLARRFRRGYGSSSPVNQFKPNAYPYFIGVFDTVASLSNPSAVLALGALACAPFIILGGALGYFVGEQWLLLMLIPLLGSAIAIMINTGLRVRWEWSQKINRRWRPFHLTEPRMKFYDTDLNINVNFARHAISIDEKRRSFERVAWGEPGIHKPSTPIWFEQVWFSGNHSDTGGSYSENESRLSDITLGWMVETAAAIGLKVDAAYLRLFPDIAGPQHDETQRSFVFSLARKVTRIPDMDAPLHSTVLDRFKLPAVLQYDQMLPYRPEGLRYHEKVKHFYSSGAVNSEFDQTVV
jgi:uncharacterized protein (DUF2235 family)